jgi:toxin ParE1/3/4
VPTRIELMPEVDADFERILQHLQDHESPDPAARIGEIIAAIDTLRMNPEIGRPAEIGFRELVIGRRRQGGFIALYRYVEEIDTAFVLGLREAGYSR